MLPLQQLTEKLEEEDVGGKKKKKPTTKLLKVPEPKIKADTLSDIKCLIRSNNPITAGVMSQW